MKLTPCCMSINKKRNFPVHEESILLLLMVVKLMKKSACDSSYSPWRSHRGADKINRLAYMIIMEAWKCNKTICLAMRSSFRLWRCKSNIRSGCKDIKNVFSWKKNICFAGGRCSELKLWKFLNFQPIIRA